ncbi:hypothetical protein HNR67_003303 [Crossiella cryophila]|uniref:Uncharacterized protein n=1 Tax=Crossiella cryophila TaxID=43355 RepID=A0A7W7C9R8_9PSEU|nr:hypothetical protein [Crossiella cryophila]
MSARTTGSELHPWSTGGYEPVRARPNFVRLVNRR